MSIPLYYNIRNLRNRRTSTMMTAFGISLVAFVLVLLLSLANGFQSALQKTGDPDNVIILRSGATSILNSYFNIETVNIIKFLPQVAVYGDGIPLVDPQILVLVNFKMADTDSEAMVNIRGVSKTAQNLRKNFKIVEGRYLSHELNEVIVGKAASGRYRNCKLGQEIKLGRDKWKIVGIFEDGGSSAESEVWGDSEKMQRSFERGRFYSAMTLRLKNPESFSEFKKIVENDPRITVAAKREQDYYQEQSILITNMIKGIGYFITVILGIGAVFGAANTMYAAVASRAREIATMRAIGFRRGSILLSFLTESVCISLMGGIIGCLLSIPFHGITTGTVNWQSMSDVVFKFEISFKILMQSVLSAMVIGGIGGFFPALRGVRVSVSDALREE